MPLSAVEAWININNSVDHLKKSGLGLCKECSSELSGAFAIFVTVVLNGITETVLDRGKFNTNENYFSMFWPNLLGRYLQKGATAVSEDRASAYFYLT